MLPDDAANVFITLSAGANSGLTIIARGELPSTESKLIHAGADRVVLPARIGAERMAELLLYKDVTQIIADTERGNLENLQLTCNVWVSTSRWWPLKLEVVAWGQPLPKSRSIGAGTFLIVALERRNGETILQPHHEIVINDGDGVALVARPGCAEAIELVFSQIRPI